MGCPLRCILFAALIFAFIGISPAGAASIDAPLALASSSRPISLFPQHQSNHGITTAAADDCAQPFTPVYQIQGSGSTAAITGKVTTQGVVVGDYELPGGTSQIRGFYLQDPAGDGDPATSDGIFVFDNGVDKVSLGQVVRVTGTVGEYNGQTQISSPTIIQCGTTGSVTPVDVTLPLPSSDHLERFEGMLVRFPQTLYVTEHFQLGRFGQVVLTAARDRLRQPTGVAAPGAAARAVLAANNLNRIIVDDAVNDQNPDPILFGRGGNPFSAANTLRGGDSVSGLVGVLAYDWAGNAASPNAYRVRPVAALGGGAPNFQAANPRPAAPSAAGGRLRVASANLLNYFNTFDGLPDTDDNCTNGAGGAAADCRGADTSDEFDRQWPKTVANLIGVGADVIGIMELENDGYGPTSAIQDLATRLNRATAPGTYAFIDADALTGQVNALGADAIKVGLLYKPATVKPVGKTAALNSEAFVNGGDSAERNRPALAQTFEEVATGEKFTVAVNHLKSKGSACDAPDVLDGQGNCNRVRTRAAEALVAWLATDPTGAADPDYLIIGDLNSYAIEDP
ncbi:MAG: ExeM/NucH family extracellular endonuclease, partial [Opitutaceae bacterium]|nr:ExeM/NucH family extracellular endonuclease [Opitutaceae bacterium]